MYKSNSIIIVCKQVFSKEFEKLVKYIIVQVNMITKRLLIDFKNTSNILMPKYTRFKHWQDIQKNQIPLFFVKTC